MGAQQQSSIGRPTRQVVSLLSKNRRPDGGFPQGMARNVDRHS